MKNRVIANNKRLSSVIGRENRDGHLLRSDAYWPILRNIIIILRVGGHRSAPHTTGGGGHVENAPFGDDSTAQTIII